MRNLNVTIKVMGFRGILGWIKRLLVTITMIEFVSFVVYWLVSVRAMSKMILIGIPVAAIFVTAIEDIIKEKTICEEDEEIEEDEEEEEEEEEEEIA